MAEQYCENCQRAVTPTLAGVCPICGEAKFEGRTPFDVQFPPAQPPKSPQPPRVAPSAQSAPDPTSLSDLESNPFAPPQTATAVTYDHQPQTDLPLASRGIRLGAWILGYLFYILTAIPGMVIFISIIGEIDPDEIDRNPAIALLFYPCVLGGPAILFIINCVLLTKYGQTIPKRMLGIRIVRYEDGSNPGFLSAVVLRTVVPYVAGQTTCCLFNLVDGLFIFGEERRCLHDMIASTTVVEG